ncbi:MAG: Lrp/AsnC ligand binding domain-containing protein [Euryarchaeota archaeon]|nr:Lrp/AsnC ligand binding domain-containing protein [Euryarchaeota archaeon]
MQSAVIIINTDIGMEASVQNVLGDLKEVDFAYVVYGVYDIVAKVTAPDMDILENLIYEKIRKIEGVRTTLTLIISGERRGG